jgi:hypothetical protein
MIGDASVTWTPQSMTSPYGAEGAYANAIAAQDPALNATVNAARLPGEDYINAALRVAQSYVLADSQRKLLNVQMQRAQQGLPPLDSGQYGLGVSMGLSPDTQKLLLYGVGALALVMLLPALLKRGR